MSVSIFNPATQNSSDYLSNRSRTLFYILPYGLRNEDHVSGEQLLGPWFPAGFYGPELDPCRLGNMTSPDV